MAKLTPSELNKVELVDLKQENAKLKLELKKKELERLSYDSKVLHMNIKIKEYEKALQQNEIGTAERAHEDLLQERRDLLKEYAKKHKVKTEVWGYDPLTGEIIENNEGIILMAQKFLYVNANGDYTEANGYEQSDFINSSAGAGDAGKPIVLDAGGKIDASMIEDGDIDHGSIGGLGDDDHTQYHNNTRGDARYYTQTILGSTSNTEGASLIGIEDASGYYAGAELEAVFDEIEAQIGGATSSTFDFTEANVLADNDSIYPALQKLDLKWGDLASSANGEGASLVGIEDAGAYFTSTDVEGALQELAADVEDGKDYVVYTVGTGGVTKGDLCYISANDTVLPYATLTNAHRGIGLAASTESAAASVNVLANDEVLTGVLTTATAGTPYYWDGSSLVTSIPSGSGSHVWQAGVAKNATDLHVEVRFIKKNI